MTDKISSETYSKIRILAALLAVLLSPQVRAQTITAEHDPAAAVKIELRQTDGRVDVLAGGKLFTSLVYRTYKKPVFYPVNNPDQQAMTRHFPMKKDVSGEQPDHPHHKSVWFAHDVDGVEFWTERHGRIDVTNVKVQLKKTQCHGPAIG